MKYPTEIVLDYESAVIFPGHGWDEEYCRKMVTEWDPGFESYVDEEELLVEEHHYKFYPRLKWCHNWFGGTGCDAVGDWHCHWEEIAPNDDLTTKYTVVYVEEKTR